MLQRLQDENCQLAALLAHADVALLSRASAGLPEDASAAWAAHLSKLQAAQAAAAKLRGERAVLQAALQGAERRDRLAELCRRQAESGAKAAAELRRQLAAREQQLQAQALAAAAAAADAQQLRGQLQEQEGELGRVLADRAELSDAVDALRRQVALLKGQASRDRVLQRMQVPS